MTTIIEHINTLRRTLPEQVTLIAVSKYHPAEAIAEAYAAGQRDFAESRVQELMLKEQMLRPTCPDIRWHFIGHLQTNKVRDLLRLPVHLIQSVDSERLMQALQAEAEKQGKQMDILLELHVAREESKTGFTDLSTLDISRYPNLRIRGLMAMATNTDDEQEIRRCFRSAQRVTNDLPMKSPILSMGMSEDYPIAIEEGSTMVRIGSAIFGERQ